MVDKNIYEILLMWDDGTRSSVFVCAATEKRIEEFISQESRFRKVAHYKINSIDIQDISDNAHVIVIVESQDLENLTMVANGPPRLSSRRQKPNTQN